MRSMFFIGIALIVLGVASLIYKGVTYTTQEKVLDIGSIQATASKDKYIPLSPLLGVVSLVGGITLVIAGSSKRKNS